MGRILDFLGRLVRGTDRPAESDRTSVSRGVGPTLRSYFDSHLESVQAGADVRQHYRRIADDRIFPRFGDVPVDGISEGAVREWWLSVGAPRSDGMSAYCLFSILLDQAEKRGLVRENPCRPLLAEEDIDVYLRTKDDLDLDASRRGRTGPPAVDRVEQTENGMTIWLSQGDDGPERRS